MRKLFVMVVLLCLLPVAVFAESGEIPCVKGNCEGWSGSYENENDITVTYSIFNNTGKTAFNINCRLLFYTYNDEYITNIHKKIEGPITQKIMFTERWPENSSKVTLEIYWSEDPLQPK